MRITYITAFLAVSIATIIIRCHARFGRRSFFGKGGLVRSYLIPPMSSRRSGKLAEPRHGRGK